MVLANSAAPSVVVVGEDLALSLRILELVENAVIVVLSDVQRTTTLRPRVEVFTPRMNAVDEIAVSYDRAYQTGIDWPPDEIGVLVTLTDYLRDFVVEDAWQAWPLCPHHGLALYPENYKDQAVWTCRKHDHTVAPIGDLPAG